MFTILRLLFTLFVLPAFGKLATAMEVISGSVHGVGATITAWTMSAPDTLVVRSSDPTKMVRLLDMWALNDTAAGILRVHSPRMHDNTQGIRQRILNNNCEPLLSGAGITAITQRLYQQDTLIVEQTGSAANYDTGHLLILYDGLGGVAARFVDTPTLRANAVNRLTVEVTVSPGAGTPGYGGAVAINSTTDLLQANTDYAIVGVTTDVRCGVIGIRGADFGNLRVGVPGETAQRHITTNYFQRLSDAYGMPLIPVINSANKGNVLIDATGQTGALTIVAELQLVQLAPRSGGQSGGQYGL